MCRNKGTTWAKATGIAKEGIKPVADRVNGQKFYAYDAEAGSVWVSTNGGASFSAVTTGLPSVPSWQLWSSAVYAVPEREGDLWLTNPSGGLYHSTNSDSTFSNVRSVEELTKLGFGRAAAGEVYPAIYIAGTVNGTSGFFRSDDRGSTWVRINDDQHQFGGVNDITGDPRRGRVYVATSGRGIMYGDSRLDCSGTLDGAAYIDSCNECAGGTTGQAACVVNGIEDSGEVQFTYLPNPFTGNLQLQLDHILQYTVTNMQGVVLETGACKSSCSIGECLASGAYLLKVQAGSKVRTVKIIKR